MKRREFLVRSCQTCAALAIIPAATLTSCSSAKGLSVAAANGLVSIPLAQLDASGKTLVNAKGAPEKMLIVKEADGSYSAVGLTCTHKGGPVKQKDGQLVCSWHGSTFNNEGKLEKGPAKADLKRYSTELAGGVLNVILA